ncbi:DNA polymerase III subunit alpha [Lactococcus nasutitermitis]|uniref:DNA polymerase III subunit alpha n=1 Tax=Lactococcus nasutitermitis TaxID=1652957 RepID=A0ABV9JGF2_9LACT|nr:DNA polymerase III subunit alpha [Lactococcus nasutitermitis]
MFVPINTKTEYSFLDSVVRVDDYLETAQKLGYRTIGICDVGNLHAGFRFAKKAVARGLQPILAIELTIDIAGLPIVLALIAKNTAGYKNLLRISSLHNYGHHVFSEIQNYLTGIALVIPEAYGNFSDLTELSKITDTFVGISQQTDKTATFSLPTLPFPAVRYLRLPDNSTLEILHTVRDGGLFDETLTADTSQLLQRPEFYENYFQKYFPEALKNLTELSKNIHYDFDEKLELPRFDKSKNAAELLRETAEQGLKFLTDLSKTSNSQIKEFSAHLTEQNSLTDLSKAPTELGATTANSATFLTDLSKEKIANSDNQAAEESRQKVYQERLNQELAVIHQMGFDDYFLIVADLLRYAREKNIYCGMGRGSAAGSLVAYALQITHVDPVKNHLIFERFLNPERVAMPDIDIDMPDDRRAELLAYMKNRYGSDHVAQIVTFSTFGKRQALRDVGKAFGMSEAELSTFTKLLAHRFGNLADEYEGNPRFKAELLRNPKLQHIYEMAQRIEGMPRQTSTHASGVVLSEQSLIHYVALKPSEDLALTQYEAPDVEAIGLLKIDFLGLRNLTIIAQMQELVQKRKKITINPLSINLEDEKTLALFRAGNTMGIFQFENPQMRRFLRNLAPTAFDDIVDATSIFRPGPSQFIPQFVARRHGKETVPEVDSSITEILAPTYGIMIYQEQIMQVAQRFAGFSLGKADLLRRAISKKKGNEFEKLKADFLAGATKMGHSTEQAVQIYDLIERFANYGFNRSHAYAYAALAFQIAYFKANFPDEFYEVQLHDRKRETMILDALDNDFKIDKPSINRMPYHDRVNDKKINLGLAHIKSVPRDMAYTIIENRPFTDLPDFVKKLPANFQKEELISPLIQIGAFDEMDDNRGKLLVNISQLIDYTQNIQLDLFGNMQLKFSYQQAEDLTQAQKYEQEKSLLSVGITPHPLQALAQHFSGNFSNFDELVKNRRSTILVEIARIRVHRTKTGQNMAFLSVTDSRSNFDVTLFPEHYREYLGQLEQGKFYFITGKVSERNDELQLLADHIVPAEKTDRKLWLNLADSSRNNKLSQILQEFPGSQQVILHFADSKTTTQTTIYAEESEQLIKRLQGYVLNAVYK